MVIVVTRARAVGKGLQLAWRIRSLSVHRMREAGLALVHEESLPDSWWDARRGQNA